ncbi:MAG: TRAP transporter large permease subunit [Planctomycetota bacterium]|nr:MAG: TRAP transporter large permease subunit [Planctomycetota bacterium]
MAVCGLGLAVLALLGTPLFVIIAGVTLLGLAAEAQVHGDLGLVVNPDGSAGVGGNLFAAWLNPMADSPLFIAIPLFTFAGTLLSESHSPTRLINLCRACLGWFPGGLALVTLVTCCFFTAFTGASGVTIIALGGLLFPILLRERYPERFSLGLLTTGGSLGLLLAPSLPVIVYGLVARVDIARLFVAAAVPMALLVLFLGVTSIVVAVATKVPRHAFSWRELGRALRAAAWELPLPFLVVGGIYKGFFNAAEAAAVTAVYVVATTVGIYRDVRPRELLGVVRRASVLVGAILLIMGTALGFADWLTVNEVPQRLLAAMTGLIDEIPWVSDRLAFLILLNGFLLLVGCLMDIFSATLVVVPLIGPVAAEFGVDPYHLAVIFLVNLEIGYSTPPVGINLFIASLRFRRPVFALYRASVLFIAVLLAALLLITYVPSLSLGLFDGLPRLEVFGEDGSPAPARLTLREGEDVRLTARVSLGGVTLEEAKRNRRRALEALRAAEERLGVSYDSLEEELRQAEDALVRAGVSAEGDLGALEERLQRARKALAPLRAEADALEAARRKVDAIASVEARIRWRSRQGEASGTGPRFSLGELEPGTHTLTVTAVDARRHLVQRVFEVVVEAAAGSGGAGADGGGADDGGEDGDWGEWGTEDGDGNSGSAADEDDWGEWGTENGEGAPGDAGEGDEGTEGSGGSKPVGPGGRGPDDAGGDGAGGDGAGSRGGSDPGGAGSR